MVKWKHLKSIFLKYPYYNKYNLISLSLSLSLSQVLLLYVSNCKQIGKIIIFILHFLLKWPTPVKSKLVKFGQQTQSWTMIKYSLICEQAFCPHLHHCGSFFLFLFLFCFDNYIKFYCKTWERHLSWKLNFFTNNIKKRNKTKRAFKIACYSIFKQLLCKSISISIWFSRNPVKRQYGQLYILFIQCHFNNIKNNMFPKKIIQPLKVLKCQVISNFNNIISYLTKTKIPQSSNILMNPLFKWD